MTERLDAPRRLDRVLDDCWNRIGVRGDGSCPELKQYVHCHNCPVFSAGAADMLDADAPDSYFVDRTAHFAEPAPIEKSATRSVVIFRVDSEWLALSTSVVVEVANLRTIHSLPHRSNGVVLGLASVRGELLVCV
jgi:chemotaxis-related protein WspD